MIQLTWAHLLLFAYLLTGPAFLLPGMLWRAFRGRGVARLLAVGALASCGALYALAAADLLPDPDHVPATWALVALPALLWAASALHPGRGARWPDALALVGPPAALGLYALQGLG